MWVIFFNICRNLGTNSARQQYRTTRKKIQASYCHLCSVFSTMEERAVQFACISGISHPWVCNSYRFYSTAFFGVLSFFH